MVPRFVRRAAAAALGAGAGFLIAACYGAPYNVRRSPPPPPEQTRQAAAPATNPDAPPPAKGAPAQPGTGAPANP